MDIGFGRICTFEFSTTLILVPLTFETGPVRLPVRIDPVAGTITSVDPGWTTTPGNILVSTSGTSTEETDSGDDISVLTEISSVSSEWRKSHSSAAISVISGLLLSPYKQQKVVLLRDVEQSSNFRTSVLKVINTLILFLLQCSTIIERHKTCNQ